MNITHLSLVSVPVADQQAAKTFYTEKLGFKIVRDLVEARSDGSNSLHMGVLRQSHW